MPFWSNLEKLGRDGVWHAGIPRPPLAPCLELGLESSGGPVLLPPPWPHPTAGAGSTQPSARPCPMAARPGWSLTQGPAATASTGTFPAPGTTSAAMRLMACRQSCRTTAKGTQKVQQRAGEHRQPGSAAVDQELLKS